MKRITLTSLVFLTLLVTAVFAGHRPGPPSPCDRMGPFSESQAWLRDPELNLTDSQLEQIEKLRLNFQQAQIKDRADLKVEELTFRKMLLENSNEKNLKKQIEKIANLRARMYQRKMEHKLQVLNVFTEEQQKKVLLKLMNRPPHPCGPPMMPEMDKPERGHWRR